MTASPHFRVVGAVCAAALALAACASSSDRDPDVGAVLAEGAERLASHLDAADECRALAEADALVDLAAASADQGLVAPHVAAEVEGVVTEAASDLTCVMGEESETPDAAASEAETEPTDAQAETGPPSSEEAVGDREATRPSAKDTNGPGRSAEAGGPPPGRGRDGKAGPGRGSGPERGQSGNRPGRGNS